MKISSHSPETLSHLLLWTPWDERSNTELPGGDGDIRDALENEKERFYKDCFVPLETASNEVDMWDKLSSLFDNISRKTIIISSFAGVGKSTMLRAMLEYKNMYKTSIILDVLEEVDLFPAGDWGEWLNKYCHKKPLHNKLIKLLIVKIYDLLFLPTPVNREKRIDKTTASAFLKHSYENMKIYFRMLDEKYKSLHDIFNQYINGAIPYDNDHNGSLITESYTHQVANTLFSLHGKENSIPIDVVRELLELLSILAICNMSNPTTDKICIAFDNIEHYIDNKIIHDEDVCELLLMVNGIDGEGFITTQNTIYRNRFYGLTKKQDKRMIFSERIRLVLVIREFTANILPSMADEIGREDDHTIKLHRQISLLEIIRKRVAFIKHVTNTDIYNDEPIKTIIQILTDEDMAENISRMFSYNKRKSIRNLIDAFYYEKAPRIPHIRTNLIKGIYGMDSTGKSKDLRKIYSHGRRQIVFRALYDSMLDNLRLGSTRLGNALKLDYFGAERGSVRQILVYLARRNFNIESNASTRQQPMVKLSDLIRDIYIKPNFVRSDNALHQFPETSPDKLEILAKTLNILRSRDHLARLSPLILLRFEQSGIIDDGDIKKELIKICKNPDYETDSTGLLRYGVQCTIAGRMFVQYCASFEFVAARHYNSLLEKTKVNPYCRPLFAAELHQTSNLITYIDAVKELTLYDCIEKMVEQVTEFLRVDGIIQYNYLYTNLLVYKVYDFNKNSHHEFELTHAERLIRHHIRYIDDYRLFAVDQLKCKARSNEGLQKVENFSLKLLDIIGQYIEMLYDLTENYISGENQFFIGGDKRNQNDDWGNKPFGYKKYQEKLAGARRQPLAIFSVAPDNEEI